MVSNKQFLPFVLTLCLKQVQWACIFTC
jgi:hypothetical protein